MGDHAAGEAELRDHRQVDHIVHGLGRGRDDLRLGLEDVAQHVQRVAAEVHRRTAAQLDPVADLLRGVVDAAAEVAGGGEHAAEPAALDDFAHPVRHRVVPVVKRLDADEAGRAGGVGYLLGLGLVEGQRLLAEHVLTGRERAQRPLACGR